MRCRAIRVDNLKKVKGYHCVVEDKHYILEESAQVVDEGPRGIEVAGFVEVTEDSVRLKKDIAIIF